MERPMSIETDDAFEISAPRVRQAYRGRRILWVLMASLVLVAAALFGTWAVRSGQLAGAAQPNVTDEVGTRFAPAG